MLRAEKVGEMESDSIRRCRVCNRKLELFRTVMVAVETLFECSSARAVNAFGRNKKATSIGLLRFLPQH